MEKEEYFNLGIALALIAGAYYIVHKTYQKVKYEGVEDDMGFRLIEYIIAFALFYASNIFYEQISSYERHGFVKLLFMSALVGVTGYALYGFYFTIKTKLGELGSKRIWKKLLYAGVISTVSAWGATFFGVVEVFTFAKVALGGLLVFSVQLFA